MTPSLSDRVKRACVASVGEFPSFLESWAKDHCGTLVGPCDGFASSSFDPLGRSATLVVENSAQGKVVANIGDIPA